MRLSTRAEYGIRVLVALAHADADRPISLAGIARADKLPHAYIEQLVADLRRAELVTATRGKSGGYALARPAAEISLADVIRAVEGPIATVRGVRPDEVRYEGAARALAPVWLDLRTAMRGVLEETTLADVVARAGSS